MRHMCARGNMKEVILTVCVETVEIGKIEQGLVDLFQIPRIVDVNLVQNHLGIRRDQRDIGFDLLCDSHVRRRANELEPVHLEIILAAQIHRGPPPGPALRPLPVIQIDSEEPYGDIPFHRAYLKYATLSP